MLLAFAGVVLAQSTTPNDPAAPGGAQQRAGDVRPDHYIVVLKDGVSSARAVADEHAQTANAQVSHVYEYALKGYAAYIPAASLGRVKNDPRVRLVERDYVQEAFDHELPTVIDRIEGEQSPTAKINPDDTANGQRVDVDIAVLDTGIEEHPDSMWRVATTAPAAKRTDMGTVTGTAPTWPARPQPWITARGSWVRPRARGCGP